MMSLDRNIVSIMLSMQALVHTGRAPSRGVRSPSVGARTRWSESPHTRRGAAHRCTSSGGPRAWWLSPRAAEPSHHRRACVGAELVPSGSEPAAARVSGSLRRFKAQSWSCDGYLGRRSKRLEAASAVEGAGVVLSTDFDRLSDGSRKCTAEALCQPQHEGASRCGGSGHG